MKSWKIHLGWACAAVIAAACGRMSSTRRAVEVPPREPEQRTIEAKNIKTAATPTDQPATSPTTLVIPQGDRSRPPLPMPGGDLSVEEIRQNLKSGDSKDWWKALKAIEGLQPGPAKKELLLEQLKSKEPYLRQPALYGLKRMIGNEASPILQEVLRTDSSPFVREHAARLLGEPGGEANIETLLNAFHGEEFAVQAAAAVSLNFLGQPGPMSEMLPRLESRLDSPDAAVRKDATERLGFFLSPLTVPLLTRALRDSSGDVRIAAAAGLATLGAPEVIPLLEPLLQDPSANVAEAARVLLKRLRSQPTK